MKSKYLCERCKMKDCSGYVESSTNPLETFHFCPKFVFDDGTPFSQADRIKNMSVEELADIIFESCTAIIGENSFCMDQKIESCNECVLEWLKSKVIQ